MKTDNDRLFINVTLHKRIINSHNYLVSAELILIHTLRVADQSPLSGNRI